MSYFVARVSGLNHKAEEWLSAHAFENGALGLSEVLDFTQPEGEEDVFTHLKDARVVDVYFETPPSRALFDDLRARFPSADVKITSEQEKDWLAEWKKGFKPFSLAGGHWVVPSWCEAPADAEHKIWIDPGMAFGTGTHETTQLVAEKLLNVSGSSLLDVGTGTGILAIMAKQLGFKKIVATEIEPDARRVALENFELNHASDIALNEKQVGDLQEKFDVVVANIIDGVLVRVQNELKDRVRPGGWLIVSGIIAEREKDFLSGFQLPSGISWESRVQKGDWLLYSVRL